MQFFYEISHHVRYEIILADYEIFFFTEKCEIKFAFHIAKQYFIHEVYFTNPKRIYFIEKTTCRNKSFFLAKQNNNDVV